VGVLDPFGHVNKMPVALVNSDRGATAAGQQFDAGTEIAKSLTRTAAWTGTSSARGGT